MAEHDEDGGILYSSASSGSFGDASPGEARFAAVGAETQIELADLVDHRFVYDCRDGCLLLRGQLLFFVIDVITVLFTNLSQLVRVISVVAHICDNLAQIDET